MGMSTHVVGFRPPDEKWKKMKAVFDACEKAGVPVPEAVDDFFGDRLPDLKGVEVDIRGAVEEYTADMVSGYTVDLEKLPGGIRYLRFYNSW